MEKPVNKSIEYKISFEGIEYVVKALIVSLPEETQISNIDMEENKGFIFTVNVLVEPDISKEIFDQSIGLIYIVGESENQRLGYLQNNEFIEVDKNRFVSGLKVSILEVLMIAGETGNFKA